MKEIFSNIGFNDSNFESCQMFDDNLTVILRAWNNKILEIVFSNVLRFEYNGGDFIEGLFEITESTHFLNETISSYFSVPPTQHSFKMYVIKDIQDEYYFQIVAEDVQIKVI